MGLKENKHYNVLRYAGLTVGLMQDTYSRIRLASLPHSTPRPAVFVDRDGVIVEEAGGKISDLDGNPYVLGGKTILATNGLIHVEMEKMAAEIGKKEKLGA